MLPFVTQVFRDCWKSLAVTDIASKAIAYVLLTPIVGLVFRLFLTVSGRTVLADVDIAKFLLHPIGLAALVVVGGAMVGILALEQSVLMVIALSSHEQKPLGPLPAFRFVTRQAPSIFHLASRMVALLLLIAAPFLAAGGGIYLALLTQHDINFYLAERPPVFWVAVLLIGSVLAAGGAVLLRQIVGWSMALPLILFENVPAAACLAASSARTHGHRKTIAGWIVAWFVAISAISAIAAGAVVWLGQLIVPHATGSIWLAALAVGIVVLLWFATNLVVTLAANTMFGVMLVGLYDQFARSGTTHLPTPSETRWDPRLRLSHGRITAVLAVGVVLATLVGAVAMHEIRLEDQAQVTAHRGASGKAPENTLAAVRQAIEDGADWVEIDVQESKDGVVVVAHDSDLKKVSGSDTKIWDATADELRSIDIGSYFDPRFKDQRVPTLAEVLDACRGKVKLNIELKYYGHDQQLERRVVDLVEQHGMAADVVVMSLDSEGIRKVKALRPDWTVGLLTAVAVSDLTRADADFLAVSTGLATRGFIRSAHGSDKEVYVWTVNDALMMSAMIGRGADNIITDHPHLAREVLAERASMSPVERLLVELAFFLGATPPNRFDAERP